MKVHLYLQAWQVAAVFRALSVRINLLACFKRWNSASFRINY